MPEGLTLPAACHSHVNHTLSELRADEKNLFSHGDYCWENDMSLESQKHLGDKADFVSTCGRAGRGRRTDLIKDQAGRKGGAQARLVRGGAELREPDSFVLSAVGNSSADSACSGSSKTLPARSGRRLFSELLGRGGESSSSSSDWTGFPALTLYRPFYDPLTTLHRP